MNIEILFDDPLQPLKGCVLIRSLRLSAVESNRIGHERIVLGRGKYTYPFTLEPDEVDNLGVLTAHGNRRVEDAVARCMSEALNKVKQALPLVITPTHSIKDVQGYSTSLVLGGTNG